MGRRDRAWPDHVGALMGFCLRSQEAEAKVGGI
jgi:hypothetical protein